MFGFSLRYRILLLLGDFLAILTAFLIAYVIRVNIDDNPLLNEVALSTYLWIFLILIPFWVIIFANLGLYTREVYEHRINEAGRVILGTFIGILFIIGIDFVLDDPIFPSRRVPVYAFGLSFLLIMLQRLVLRSFRSRMFKYGTGVNHVMLIGNNDTTADLINSLSHTSKTGYNMAAYIGSKQVLKKTNAQPQQFASLSEGLDSIKTLGINTIIQTEFFEDPKRNQRIWEAAQTNHLDYKFIPSQSELYSGKNTVELFQGLPIVTVSPTPLIGWGRIVKRITDIVLSVLLLIPGSIIILISSALIKIHDPSGPAFYKHKRLSRFGDSFEVLKLRTMYQKYCAGKQSEVQIFKSMGRDDLIAEFEETRKVANDPRITPLGKFFRATSIDELPQLFNVLRGDISLIGPRPIVKEELKLYKNAKDILVSIKPGLSGLWQVSGRSDLSVEERVELDVYYVQNWSFWLDAKIFLKTIYVVLKKTGAK